MDTAEIDKRFTHHPPRDEATVNRHENTREAYKNLAHQLDEALPDSREKSIAYTALEESLMWANAAIARNAPTE